MLEVFGMRDRCDSSGNPVTTTHKRKHSKDETKNRTSQKVFILILLLVAIFITSLFLPIFNVARIQVKGNEKIDSEDIVTASGVEIGENIFRVSGLKTKNDIKNISYIENVVVKRSFPNRIIISVSERKAIGYISFMGSYILIDKRGTVLEVVSTLDDVNIPVISGLNFNRFEIGDTLAVENLSKLDIVFECLQHLLKNDMICMISKIDVHDIDNIQMIARNTIVVNVGNHNNINFKMSFLKEILSIIQEEEEGYIDLSIDKPVFKPLN